MARVMDFGLPRQKESMLPLLADAQSAAVGSKHPSREGQENPANAK
jgi:hypothetical protein